MDEFPLLHHVFFQIPLFLPPDPHVEFTAVILSSTLPKLTKSIAAPLFFFPLLSFSYGFYRLVPVLEFSSPFFF